MPARKDEEQTVEISRRKALARLGLAVGVAYSAPTLLRLDRKSRATIFPTAECSPGYPDCPFGPGGPGGPPAP